MSLSRASISVTHLPSCLKKEKKEKSYLETEMRERKVEKQMQGAQTGVHGSLLCSDRTFRRIKHKCSSVIL